MIEQSERRGYLIRKEALFSYGKLRKREVKE